MLHSLYWRINIIFDTQIGNGKKNVIAHRYAFHRKTGCRTHVAAVPGRRGRHMHHGSVNE